MLMYQLIAGKMLSLLRHVLLKKMLFSVTVFACSTKHAVRMSTRIQKIGINLTYSCSPKVDRCTTKVHKLRRLITIIINIQTT